MKTNKHFSSYLVQFFLAFRNVSGKKDVEKIKTHILFNNFFLNRAIYEIWKYIVQQNRVGRVAQSV
jgi:hypothetical protein